jgi:hypothetical protein
MLAAWPAASAEVEADLRQWEAESRVDKYHFWGCHNNCLSPMKTIEKLDRESFDHS